MPKSEASKRWDAKNIKVLSVGLRTAEALEVSEAAIDAGLSVKGWLRAIIREKLEMRSKRIVNRKILAEPSILETASCWEVVDLRSSCGFGPHKIDECSFYGDIDAGMWAEIRPLLLRFGKVYLSSCFFLLFAVDGVPACIVETDPEEIQNDTRFTKVAVDFAWRIQCENEALFDA